jgi:hypothetical protein
MAINFEKVCGWVLVFAGLALIVYSVRTSYGYFTGKSLFPALVQAVAFQDKISDAGSASEIDLTDQKAVQQMMQVQVQTSIDKTVSGMIPAGSIVVVINAAIWSVFATFLVYAGAKISEVGIKLLAAKTEAS